MKKMSLLSVDEAMRWCMRLTLHTIHHLSKKDSLTKKLRETSEDCCRECSMALFPTFQSIHMRCSWQLSLQNNYTITNSVNNANYQPNCIT